MLSRIRRLLTVLVAVTAWLALSNHCALSALASSNDSAPEMSGCPMHSAPKKEPAQKTPCCKEVRAVVAKCVQVSPVSPHPIGLRDYAAEIFREPSLIMLHVQGLDTGPPDCLSFAESVLQESMLSHAPPVS